MKDSYNLLKTGFDMIDNDLSKMQDVGKALRREANFTTLAQLSNQDIGNTSYVPMIFAQRFMQAVVPRSDLFLNTYFIFKNNDIMISPEIITTRKEDMYGKYFCVQDMPMQKWFDTVSESKGRDMVSIQPVQTYLLGNGTGVPDIKKEVITYQSSLLNITSLYSDCTLVCLLDSEYIKKVLCSEYIAQKGSFVIANAQNDVVMNYPASSRIKNYKDTGVFEEKIGNVNTTVLSLQSSNSGLKITAQIPTAALTQRIEEVMWLLRFFFIASIVLGLFISLYFAYRNSLPLKKIMKTLDIYFHENSKSRNEYDRIRETIEELSRTKKEYEGLINSLDSAFKMNLFEKLLRKSILSKGEQNEVDRCFEFLQKPYFIVILQWDEEQMDSLNLDIQEFEMLLKIIAEEELKSVIKGTTFVHMLYRQIVAVFPAEEGTETKKETAFIQRIEACLRAIDARTGFSLQAGVSLSGNGMEEVCRCYNQAMEVLRVADKSHPGQLHFFSEEMMAESQTLINMKDVQRLYELILAGDILAIEKNLSEILQGILSRKSISSQELRRIYYNIQNIFIIAAKEIVREGDDPVQFEEYAEEKSIIYLFEQLNQSALLLTDKVNQRKKSKNNKLKEETLEYIYQHFEDPTLCAVGVADVLNISEKYLFNFVKEQTGMSFGDLLLELRLKKAMSLMKETEQSIGEISVQVGFNSQNTFNKVFKRVYGLSPGTWRKGLKAE